MFKYLKNLFKNTIFNICLIFFLTGFVFYITLKDHYHDVINYLNSANPWYLFLLFILLFIDKALLGKGLALEVQVSNKHYRFREGLVNAYIAGLFNNITPGASGGQFAQLYIFRKQGVCMESAVGVLWLDFIVYQITMIIFVLFLLIARFSYFYYEHSSFFLIVIAGFMVALSIIVFLFLIVKSKRFYTWLTTRGVFIAYKFHFVKNIDTTVQKINMIIDNVAKEILILHQNHNLIYQLIIINVLRFMILYSVPIFCALALNIPFKLINIVDMFALSSFVSMVNAFLPMPGSSGGTEATFILMFSTIFNSIQATSIMILWRLSTFYLSLIMGSLVFLLVKMFKIGKEV